MRNVIKYALFGLAGWLAYTNFTSPTNADTAQEGTGSEPSGAAAAIASAINLRARVLAAAGVPDSQLLTFDQWNYYFRTVRGVDGPAPEDAMPGQDRNRLLSIDEWLKLATPLGVGSLVRFRR